MKKQFYAVACSLFLAVSLNAQITTTSQWTWVKGDNTAFPSSVRGTRGVAAAANKPSGRESSVVCKDASGNIWFFGGNIAGSGFFNDLWKYNPATNQWTWINGSDTSEIPATYGVKGIADQMNNPGIRYGAIGWSDTNGNFWLFGGSTMNGAFRNDLWKYNPISDMWTWINGDSTIYQPGIYGTMETAAATNKPGARYGSVAWTDAVGDFWLFGGLSNTTYPYNSSNVGSLNDLWKYNVATNQWTWVSGSGLNIYNQSGIYGTKGIGDAANVPGSRYSCTSWVDTNGNFWIFGGEVIGSRVNVFNDLWKFNPSANVWTWVSGANTVNQPGSYGTLGVPSANNNPSARISPVTWVDATNNLWLFGGWDYSYKNFFNDLWKYNTITNQWTWINGANIVNQRGVYGTLGMAAATNTPGSRFANASWIDGVGNFWLLGGFGYTGNINNKGDLNDLWKLGNTTVLPVTITSIKAYQQTTNIAVEWKVQDESNIKEYGIEKSTDGITFNHVGTKPAIGNNLSSVDYSWLDVNALPGNNFYRIQSKGMDGTVNYSQVVKVTIRNGKSGYEVYPNPVAIDGTLHLQFINQLKGTYQVRLMNVSGQVVQSYQIAHAGGSRTEPIQPNSHLAKGQYVLEITAPDNSRQLIKVMY